MIYYNVVSNVGEWYSCNDTYFTTIDKDLAEKYLQKYNKLKQQHEELRKNYEKVEEEFRGKLCLELFGLTSADEDFFEKTCNLTDEEIKLYDDKFEEFVNNLPLEIRAGIFTSYFPELTIVESTDEMNFEKFVCESAEEDIKEYLRNLI